MRGWGIMLIVLGVGSFVLPRFGMQFILMDLFGDYLPIAAVVISILGAGMVAASFFTGRSTNP